MSSTNTPTTRGYTIQNLGNFSDPLEGSIYLAELSNRAVGQMVHEEAERGILAGIITALGVITSAVGFGQEVARVAKKPEVEPVDNSSLYTCDLTLSNYTPYECMFGVVETESKGLQRQDVNNGFCAPFQKRTTSIYTDRCEANECPLVKTRTHITLSRFDSASQEVRELRIEVSTRAVPTATASTNNDMLGVGYMSVDSVNLSVLSKVVNGGIQGSEDSGSIGLQDLSTVYLQYSQIISFEWDDRDWAIVFRNPKSAQGELDWAIVSAFKRT